MRENLIILLLALPTLAIVNALIAWYVLSTFVRGTPGIDTQRDMDRFKRVISYQMYGALLQIALLLPPTAIYFVGLAVGTLGVGDIAFLLVPSFIVVAVGALGKKIEARAKALPVTEEFAGEYQRVLEVWVKSPLPKW